MLRLTTLGGLLLSGEQGCMPVQRRRLALLALLAGGGERGVSRDRLLAILWPESDGRTASNNLKQMMFVLRRDLGSELFVGARAQVQLNPRIISCDRWEFEAAIASGRWESAIELYGGAFLDGFHPGSEAEEFERWVDAERAALQQAHRDALQALALAGETVSHGSGVRWWRRLVACDPLDGGAVTGLMRSLAAAGDAAGALEQARRHTAALEQELGAGADPNVSALAAAIRRSLSRHPAAMPSPGAPDLAPRLTAAGAPSREPGPSYAEDAARRPRRRDWLASVYTAFLVLAFSDAQPAARDATLDADIIAIAPFQILTPGLELWREGTMDYLARSLDGAGALRTVSPSVVMRQRGGRGDALSARQVGRRTGAGLAVFGDLVAAGRDSVRARASVLDVQYDRLVGYVEVRGTVARMDEVLDSLAFALLREIGRSRPGATAHFASLGSVSLPAIKAFLRGEQQFRRGFYDSAQAEYERAIASDADFALAFRQLAQALAWRMDEPAADSLISVYNHRAGMLLDRLPARERLLTSADALWGDLNGVDDSLDWPRQRRIVAMHEEAVRRYPADAEAWYRLGESRYHLAGPPLGVTARMALDAFDAAIRRDSAYAAAYEHTVGLALEVGGPALARRYALAANRPEHPSPAMRLITTALDDSSPVAAEHLARGTPIFDLIDAYSDLVHDVSPSEPTLRLIAEAARQPPDPRLDPEMVARHRALVLAFRGHLRAADAQLATLHKPSVLLAVQLAIMGAGSATRADSIGADALRSGAPIAFLPLLPWWSGRGDSASLHRAARLCDSLRRAPRAPAALRALAEYGRVATAGYAALEAGDSAAALAEFAALPDSVCGRQCAWHRYTKARLYATHARVPAAIAQLRADLLEQLDRMPMPLDVLWRLELARQEERSGAAESAAAGYVYAAKAWVHGDPSVAPYVEAARAGAGRLTRSGSEFHR